MRDVNESVDMSDFDLCKWSVLKLTARKVYHHSLIICDGKFEHVLEQLDVVKLSA